MVQIIWSPQARDDLKTIVQYFAQDSPEYAHIFLENIFLKVKYLSKFPFLGRIIPELNQSSKREIISNYFRIMYQIKTEKIEIIAIIHCRQFFQEKKS